MRLVTAAFSKPEDPSLMIYLRHFSPSLPSLLSLPGPVTLSRARRPPAAPAADHRPWQARLAISPVDAPRPNRDRRPGIRLTGAGSARRLFLLDGSLRLLMICPSCCANLIPSTTESNRPLSASIFQTNDLRRTPCLMTRLAASANSGPRDDPSFSF